KFRTPPFLATIFDVIVLECHLADLRPALKAQPGAECDQGWRHVPDRRAVGDVAADRAEVADLYRADAVDEGGELRTEPHQVVARVRVGRSRPETQAPP